MRLRISIIKEDRIWNLRCQGYDYETIASLVNSNPKSMTKVIRRVRQRPPLEKDPIRRGRYRGYLSDSQIEDIRDRYTQGENVQAIADEYYMTASSVYAILSHRSYKEPSNDGGYPYNFSNRLTQRQ